MDGWADRRVNGCKHGWINGWMDRQVGTDRYTLAGREMDRETDRQIDRNTAWPSLCI